MGSRMTRTISIRNERGPPPLSAHIDNPTVSIVCAIPDAWPASSPIRSSTFHSHAASPSWYAAPRLSRRLRHATRAKVTLISAPPGFGKTTLLANWLAACASDDVIPVWVSLDATDNESVAFWFGVATAFHRAGAHHPERQP